MSDMREFLLKLESELDETDKKIEDLEADLKGDQTEAELAAGPYRTGREELLRTVRRQREALRDRIARTRTQPEPVWQESRHALQRAWDELKEAVHRLTG